MKHSKRVGGNLQQALEQKHSFNPLEVLKEGVELTKSTIPSLLGAALLALAIFTIILMLALQIVVGDFDVENEATRVTMLLIQIMVLSPLFAGIYVMGIRHSVGGKTRANDVFRFAKQPFPFILVAMMTQIISQLAAGLLPGAIALLAVAFIWVTLSMAMPLAAEYKLSPIQAIRCSFIAVIKRFGAFFSIYAAMFGLFLLGAFTFGLALIVVVPFFYNVTGIMYREVFGVEVPDDDTDHDLSSGNAAPGDHSDSHTGTDSKKEKDTWNA